MIAVSVLALFNATFILGSIPPQSNPDYTATVYSESDVARLVTKYEEYSSTPSLYDSDLVFENPNLLNEWSTPNRKRLVRTCLVSLLPNYDKLFDSVRNTYALISTVGDEQEMGAFRAKIRELFDRQLIVLAYCLPLTADYQVQECGLVEFLQELVSICSERKEFKYGLWARMLNPPSSLMTATFSSSSLTTIQQGKKYAMAILKYELLKSLPQDRARLVDKVVPLLSLRDVTELNVFLNEKFQEDITDKVNEHIYGKDLETTLIENCISKSSNSTKQSGEYIGLTELLSIPGLGKEILTHINWKTLCYVLPNVNKYFNAIITKHFIIDHCNDLKSHLYEEAKVHSPDNLYHFKHPWSSLFPTVHHLVQYYVENVKDGEVPKLWSQKLLDGLQVCHYKDDRLVEKCLEFLGKNFFVSYECPLDCMVRIVNIVLKNPKCYENKVFRNIDGKRAMSLIERVDNPKGFFEIVSNDKLNRYTDSLYTAILIADELNWSEELKMMAEAKILSICSVHINLPFTAKQIQKLSAEELGCIIHAFTCQYTPYLLIKVVNALSESHDCLLRDVFTTYEYSIILSFLNAKDPHAMSAEQLRLFLLRAIQLNGDDSELQEELHGFETCITRRRH